MPAAARGPGDGALLRMFKEVVDAGRTSTASERRKCGATDRVVGAATPFAEALRERLAEVVDVEAQHAEAIDTAGVGGVPRELAPLK